MWYLFPWLPSIPTAGTLATGHVASSLQERWASLRAGTVRSYQACMAHRPCAGLGLLSPFSLWEGNTPGRQQRSHHVHPFCLPLGDAAECGDDCTEGGARPTQSDIWGQGTKGAASEGHQGPGWGHREVSEHDLFNFTLIASNMSICSVLTVKSCRKI